MKKYKLLKEEWRDVPICGLEKTYKVSNTGKVISVMSNKILTPYPNWAGYLTVHLRNGRLKINKVVAIHRMVAIAFLGDKTNYGLQVDHIDNDKNNNSVSNLQWITGSENVSKAFKQGRPSPKGNSITDRRGHKSPTALLSKREVLEIKNLLKKEEVRNIDIARTYGVAPAIICNIKKGRNYNYA